MLNINKNNKLQLKKQKNFIDEANNIHNNKYDYSKVNYIDAKTKVIIICKEHGEFMQTPNSHLKPTNCKQCSLKKNGDINRDNSHIFIEKAKRIHGDRYDYSKVNYINAHENVTIICSKHGDFEQIADAHLRGKNCIKCSNIYNYTTEEWISKAKETHGDKYDYSKAIYVNYKTKLTIICNEHGEFTQAAGSHIYGNGCRECSYKYRNYGINNHYKYFVKRANKIHNNIYDYSKVQWVNYATEVIIICKIHGDFIETPLNHMDGNGCTNCNMSILRQSIEYKIEKFIVEARSIHGTRYDYSNIGLVTENTEILIKCSIHGEFKQIAKDHLNGKGCSKCFGNNRYDTEIWIKLAKKIYGDKYDYSETKYEQYDKKIKIICPIHGKFKIIPFYHLQGSECKKCSITKKALDNKITTHDFIEKASSIHNDKYDYSKVIYKNSKDHITIICPIHGAYSQRVQDHISGSGCIECGKEKTFKNRSYNKDEWIKRANITHHNKYDYSKVNYINTRHDIIIICKIHGEYIQKPSHHLKGYGCNKCNMCPKCQLWRTYGELCVYCAPQEENKQYQKTKEMAVVKFLKNNLPNNDFIHNRSVGSECTGGHLFPDIRFDRGFYNLIIEIDEYKHRGADYVCDEKRMYDIITKLGVPCIFIRYNPDSKKSNMSLLLEKVKEYLNYEYDENRKENVWDDFGFKVEYLFY